MHALIIGESYGEGSTDAAGMVSQSTELQAYSDYEIRE